MVRSIRFLNWNPSLWDMFYRTHNVRQGLVDQVYDKVIGGGRVMVLGLQGNGKSSILRGVYNKIVKQSAHEDIYYHMQDGLLSNAGVLFNWQMNAQLMANVKYKVVDEMQQVANGLLEERLDGLQGVDFMNSLTHICAGGLYGTADRVEKRFFDQMDYEKIVLGAFSDEELQAFLAGINISDSAVKRLSKVTGNIPRSVGYIIGKLSRTTVSVDDIDDIFEKTADRESLNAFGPAMYLMDAEDLKAFRDKKEPPNMDYLMQLGWYLPDGEMNCLFQRFVDEYPDLLDMSIEESDQS